MEYLIPEGFAKNENGMTYFGVMRPKESLEGRHINLTKELYKLFCFQSKEFRVLR